MYLRLSNKVCLPANWSETNLKKWFKKWKQLSQTEAVGRTVERLWVTISRTNDKLGAQKKSHKIEQRWPRTQLWFRWKASLNWIGNLQRADNFMESDEDVGDLHMGYQVAYFILTYNTKVQLKNSCANMVMEQHEGLCTW